MIAEKWFRGRRRSGPVVRVPISPTPVAPDISAGSIQHTAGDARRIALVQWKQPTLFAIPVSFGAIIHRTYGHTLEVLDPIASFAHESRLVIHLCARETRYRRVRVDHVSAVMPMIERSARSCFIESLWCLAKMMKLLEARAWCRYLLLFLGSSSSSCSQAIYLSGQFPYESVRVYAAVIIIVDNHNNN